MKNSSSLTFALLIPLFLFSCTSQEKSSPEESIESCVNDRFEFSKENKDTKNWSKSSKEFKAAIETSEIGNAYWKHFLKDICEFSLEKKHWEVNCNDLPKERALDCFSKAVSRKSKNSRPSQEYVNYLLSTFLVMLKTMEQENFTSDKIFAFEASVLNFILITGDLMKQKVSPRDFLKTSTPFELSALKTMEEYEKARELEYWSKFRSFVAKRLKSLEELQGTSQKNINEINDLKRRATALP